MIQGTDSTGFSCGLQAPGCEVGCAHAQPGRQVCSRAPPFFSASFASSCGCAWPPECAYLMYTAHAPKRCILCLHGLTRAHALLHVHAPLQECEALARAMKEWDRRPKERAGFSNLPADCMSFKHLRDVSGWPACTREGWECRCAGLTCAHAPHMVPRARHVRVPHMVAGWGVPQAGGHSGQPGEGHEGGHHRWRARTHRECKSAVTVDVLRARGA